MTKRNKIALVASDPIVSRASWLPELLARAAETKGTNMPDPLDNSLNAAVADALVDNETTGVDTTENKPQTPPRTLGRRSARLLRAAQQEQDRLVEEIRELDGDIAVLQGRRADALQALNSLYEQEQGLLRS